MMIKHLCHFLRAYWKEHGTTHIKIHKSKILIYDEDLKKYVSAEELLIPAKITRIEHGGIYHKNISKELWFINTLLSKFINPSLDLILPRGKDIIQASNLCECKIIPNNASSTFRPDSLWCKREMNNGQLNLALSTVNYSSNSNEQFDGIGWAGQTVGKPYSDPRPEHSKSTPCLIGSEHEEPKTTKSKTCIYYINTKDTVDGEKSRTNNNSKFTNAYKSSKSKINNKDNGIVFLEENKKANKENHTIKSMVGIQEDNAKLWDLIKKTKCKANKFKKICGKLFSELKAEPNECKSESSLGKFIYKSNNYQKSVEILGNIGTDTCETVFQNNTTKDNSVYSHTNKNENSNSINTRFSDLSENSGVPMPKKETIIDIFEKSNTYIKNVIEKDNNNEKIEQSQNHCTKLLKQSKEIKIEESIRVQSIPKSITAEENKTKYFQVVTCESPENKIKEPCILTNTTSSMHSKYNFVAKPKRQTQFYLSKNKHLQSNNADLNTDIKMDSKEPIPVKNVFDNNEICKNIIIKCAKQTKSSTLRHGPKNDVQHLKVEISKGRNNTTKPNDKKTNISNVQPNVSICKELIVNDESRKCLPLLQRKFIEEYISEKLNHITVTNIFNDAEKSLEVLKETSGTYLGFKVCSASSQSKISENNTCTESINEIENKIPSKCYAKIQCNTKEVKKSKDTLKDNIKSIHIKNDCKFIIPLNEDKSILNVNSTNSKSIQKLSRDTINSIKVNEDKSKIYTSVCSSQFLKDIKSKQSKNPINDKITDSTKFDGNAESTGSDDKNNQSKNSIIDKVKFQKTHEHPLKEIRNSDQICDFINKKKRECYSRNELIDFNNNMPENIYTNYVKPFENAMPTVNNTKMRISGTNDNSLLYKDDSIDKYKVGNEKNNKKIYIKGEYKTLRSHNRHITKNNSNRKVKSTKMLINRPWKRKSVKHLKVTSKVTAPKSYTIVKGRSNKRPDNERVSELNTKGFNKSEINTKINSKTLKWSTSPEKNVLKTRVNHQPSIEFLLQRHAKNSKPKTENSVKCSNSLPNLLFASKKSFDPTNQITNTDSKSNTVSNVYSSDMNGRVIDSNVNIAMKPNEGNYKKLYLMPKIQTEMSAPLKVAKRKGIKSFSQSKLLTTSQENGKISSNDVSKTILNTQKKTETYHKDSNIQKSLFFNNTQINITTKNKLKNNLVKYETLDGKLPLKVHRYDEKKFESEKKHKSEGLKCQPIAKCNPWDELKISLKSKRFPKNIIKKVKSEINKLEQPIEKNEIVQNNEIKVTGHQKLESKKNDNKQSIWLDNKTKNNITSKSTADYLKRKTTLDTDIQETSTIEHKNIQEGQDMYSEIMKNKSVMQYKSSLTRKENGKPYQSNKKNNTNIKTPCSLSNMPIIKSNIKPSSISHLNKKNKHNKNDNKDTINIQLELYMTQEDGNKYKDKTKTVQQNKCVRDYERNVNNEGGYYKNYLNKKDNVNVRKSTTVNNLKTNSTMLHENKPNQESNINVIRCSDQTTTVKIKNVNKNQFVPNTEHKNTINVYKSSKKASFDQLNKSNFDNTKNVHCNTIIQNNHSEMENGKKYVEKPNKSSHLTVFNNNLIYNNPKRNPNSKHEKNSNLKDVHATNTNEPVMVSVKQPGICRTDCSKIHTVKPIKKITNGSKKSSNANSIPDVSHDLFCTSENTENYQFNSKKSKQNNSLSSNLKTKDDQEKIKDQFGLTTKVNNFQSGRLSMRKITGNQASIPKYSLIEKIPELATEKCYVDEKNRYEPDIEKQSKNEGNKASEKYNTDNKKYVKGRNNIILKTCEPFISMKNKYSNINQISSSTKDNKTSQKIEYSKKVHTLQLENNNIFKSKGNQNKSNCDKTKQGLQSNLTEHIMNPQRGLQNSNFVFGSHPQHKINKFDFKSNAKHVARTQSNNNSTTKIKITKQSIANKYDSHETVTEPKSYIKEKADNNFKIDKSAKLNNYSNDKKNKVIKCNKDEVSDSLIPNGNPLEQSTLSCIKNNNNTIHNKQIHLNKYKAATSTMVKTADVKKRLLKDENNSNKMELPSDVLKTKRCLSLDKRLRKIYKRDSQFKPKINQIKVIY